MTFAKITHLRWVMEVKSVLKYFSCDWERVPWISAWIAQICFNAWPHNACFNPKSLNILLLLWLPINFPFEIEKFFRLLNFYLHVIIFLSFFFYKKSSSVQKKIPTNFTYNSVSQEQSKKKLLAINFRKDSQLFFPHFFLFNLEIILWKIFLVNL